MSAHLAQRPALAAEKGAALLAERLGARGDRPALKKNLVARPQVQMGETRFMVKDPDRTKYYIFPDNEWRLIELFDGTRTCDEIVDDYNARVSPIPSTWPSSWSTRRCCARSDLLERSVAERNLALLAGARTARSARRRRRPRASTSSSSCSTSSTPRSS